MRCRFSLAALVSAVWPLLLTPDLQAQSTPWQDNPQGRVRLISAENRTTGSGPLWLGVHFQPAPGWYLYWKNPGESGIPPSIDWKGSQGLRGPTLFFPQPDRLILPGGIIEYGYEKELVYPVRAQAASPASGQIRIRATLDYLTCDTSCIPYRYTFALDLPVGPEAAIDEPASALIEHWLAAVPSDDRSDESIMAAAQTFHKTPGAPIGSAEHRWRLWMMLALAVAGGLLLNIMPCVLPVLSIKLMGLLQHSGESRKKIVRHALASAAGILASFMALALAAILARRAGAAVGWGVQFQEPVFVAFLALVVFFFALNLWGVFEIGLPRVFGHFATSFGQGESTLSHFTSGLFATLLATPCSAPFLGTAMGFALAQPSITILLIFLAVGTGMALPYFILAAFPRSIRWLPKPGNWMNYIKVVLGFFLAATVVWLVFVLSSQISPEGQMLFQLALVGMGLFAWLRQVFLTHPRLASPVIRRFITFLLVALVLGSLHTVGTHRQASRAAKPATPGDLAWIPFDESAIAGYLKEGRPVFVDVTADWCVTCKYNERFVLNQREVVDAFLRQDVVMMKADWTNRDADIAAYLKRYNRVGIPFYAYYQPGRSPVLLSEFLTPGQVLDALE